jgi:hypothetical protein
MAATCFLFALADHLPNLWNSNKKNHDNATLSGTPRSGGSTQLDAIPITVQVSDSSSPANRDPSDNHSDHKAGPPITTATARASC